MGQLLQLMSLVSARLEADTEFADVTVLTERKGDIESEIARALSTLTAKGGKMGVCAIVMAPLANVSNRNLPGPYLDPVNLVIHVEEAVTINTGASGTNRAASDVAERALALLHRWTPDGFPRPLLAESAAIVAAEPAVGDLAYRVRLSWAVGVSVTLSTVATPTFSSDTGGFVCPVTVTLACATAGSTIYYTLDNSTPTVGGGTLYTAPIAFTETACQIRAIAVRPGWLNSAIASKDITLNT
jgi:hypothetical protein